MSTFDDEIEDPADDYAGAMGQGARFMALAQHAYDEAEATEVDDLSTLHVARATYLQTRALSFYQFAALIGPEN